MKILSTRKVQQCDYAIIIAFEDDEMEQVLPFITKVGEIEAFKHLIEYGYLKSNKHKTIVYVSQHQGALYQVSVR